MALLARFQTCDFHDIDVLKLFLLVEGLDLEKKLSGAPLLPSELVMPAAHRCGTCAGTIGPKLFSYIRNRVGSYRARKKEFGCSEYRDCTFFILGHWITSG
eukprot:TRINITY_DN8787_c0_g1_i2.p1 TRINITY_DN8787_c0_g1~~TRINITY_DN8787_c0_g1_i2.p1  ORF type:complete len:101 (-),score=6.22 TRINITY_DN8787_c0_g1_i2:855-1157(-)